LDAALPVCEQCGLRVVVDLHSPPGGRLTSGGYAGADHGLFTSAACQRKFVEVWQQMARKYKDVKAIWGYDLVNEPVEEAADDELADWQELAERAATAIREIDPVRTIIVEPAQWGGPDGLKELRPLEVANVVYSVHMYAPHTFTHQGVYAKGRTFPYPGEIDGRQWGKAQLEAALQPAVDFQKAYGVHMYIGEFSAIRWAPDNSACRYLKDLIDIFEAHGWDWSYHAFREWMAGASSTARIPKTTAVLRRLPTASNCCGLGMPRTSSSRRHREKPNRSLRRLRNVRRRNSLVPVHRGEDWLRAGRACQCSRHAPP